jgi:hypothetical protein
MQTGFSLYVLDEDEGAALAVEGNAFSVQLGAPNAVRSLKVIIGTTAFAQQASGGIPLTPVEYALAQNYPNPFNPLTTIRYTLAKRSDVVLEIFNLLGQRVKTLVRVEQTAGLHAVVWDGTTESGANAASGAYLYRIQSSDFSASKKLILLR